MSAQSQADAYGALAFSQAQADLLDSAARFCADQSPREKVRTLMNSDTGFDADVWAAIVDMGWLGTAIPDAYEGGVGLGAGDLVPVLEQMGRHLLATPFMGSVLSAHLITVFGSEAQKSALLPAITRGDIISLAMMEADGAWEPLRAKAGPGADGKTLRGEKVLVPYADHATAILVLIEKDGSPAIAVIKGDAITPAALRRETLIDETQRTFTLSLDGLVCDEVDMIAGPGLAAALRSTYQVQALLSAAVSVGAAHAVIDYTTDYLRTRKQFGKPIGAYQALKHPMVDAYVGAEQARSHLYSAAASIDQQGTGEIAVRMARAAADQALCFAADRAIQFHGGFGFTYDCDAQLYRRFGAYQAALYGDAAYHRAKLAPLLFG
ncbi:MAG: acyl-CoA dehydrogenase family protein [Pseudomonadota bacterium]